MSVRVSSLAHPTPSRGTQLEETQVSATLGRKQGAWLPGELIQGDLASEGETRAGGEPGGKACSRARPAPPLVSQLLRWSLGSSGSVLRSNDGAEGLEAPNGRPRVPGTCGLRLQRLTFLAKSRTPPSSAPPHSVHLGLRLLISKMGRTPPPSQDRDESPCRGEAPAAETPAPTPPHPCPVPPLHRGREEGGQVGPWPWTAWDHQPHPGKESPPPITAKSTTLPAQEPRGLAVGPTQDWALEGRRPTRAGWPRTSTNQGSARTEGQGRHGGLGADGGGSAAEDQAAGRGARGKAGRPENGLGLQAAHSRCSVNAWWGTEHSP